MNEVNVNFEEIIAMAKTELSKNKMHVENYDLNVLIAGSTGVGKALEKGVEMMSKDEFETSDLLVISDGDFDDVSQRIVGKMDKQREQENRFFLLDITEKSKTIGYFDKHFLYDGKNVKALGEVAENLR